MKTDVTISFAPLAKHTATQVPNITSLVNDQWQTDNKMTNGTSILRV